MPFHSWSYSIEWSQARKNVLKLATLSRVERFFVLASVAVCEDHMRSQAVVVGKWQAMLGLTSLFFSLSHPLAAGC